MNAFLVGRRAARERLSGRAPWSAALLATALVVAAAAALRRDSPEDAADLTLGGAVFGVAIPLVVYAAVARACRYGRLDDALRPFARYGADRRSLALGLVAETALRAGLLAAIIAGSATLVAHGAWSWAALQDAGLSAWLGALGGAAYAAFFSLGSLAGKKGGGRLGVLVLDASAASFASFGALLPRPHLRSLIGGALVSGLGESQSLGILCLLTIAVTATCLAVVPP